jgi:hypothetical protein
MTEQLSIALGDGSSVTLPDDDWIVLASAGLSDEEKLGVLKHSTLQRFIVFGKVGAAAEGEAVSRWADVADCLRRVCERLELPHDLVYSCARRLPVKV